MVNLFFIACFLVCIQLSSFEKVVIWGHKLHSHTHSYIHNAFFRAFQEMGYETYWLDDSDNVKDIDFSNSLFLTEGQVDKNIPLRDDCRYILHNCHALKYMPYYDNKKAFSLQVYTDGVFSNPYNKKIEPCIYFNLEAKCVFMPWATDLLPGEIEEIKRRIPFEKKNNTILWIGTLGDGEFGNMSEVAPFKKAAESKGIKFRRSVFLDVEDHANRILHSYMAPAIVGAWQKKQGYIPCRIFKNISYGQMGVTNSLRVYELFEKKIVYNPDTAQLFFDADEKIKNMNLEDLYELIDFVKTKHTYINRIQTLLDFLKLVENQE